MITKTAEESQKNIGMSVIASPKEVFGGALKSKSGGFTFVETVLTVIIIGIIASVAAKVLTTGLDVYSLIVNRNNVFHSSRVAMERMQDEMVLLRSADVISLGSSNFRFRDTDGVSTNFWRDTVSRGSQSVRCIKRGSDYLASELIVGTSALRFLYYDINNNTTSTPANLRRINIDFTMQAPFNAGTVHLRSDVFPRNFMYSNFQ